MPVRAVRARVRMCARNTARSKVCRVCHAYCAPSGSHVFDVSPLPPPASRGLPLNTRVSAYTVPSAALRNAEWTPSAMWILQPEYR
jgi:hypothetical protein